MNLKWKLQDTTSHQSEWPSLKTTNNKCYRGYKTKGTFLHCWWECKLVCKYGKQVCKKVGTKVKSESEVTQSCLTLSDPVDCSLRGSSIHGILQARILEWVAISFSRGSSWPRNQVWVSRLQADTLTSEPPAKPWYIKLVYKYINMQNSMELPEKTKNRITL